MNSTDMDCPLQIADLRSGMDYLAQLSLANPVTAERQLMRFLDALLGEPPEPGPLYALLEQARTPLCFVEEEMARRYHNRALPLADGYSTSFRNFDVQSQKGKIVQLAVVGSERITVPAGTFDAYKLELSADDGQKTTVWVAKDTHQPVKFSAVVPRMNGAVVTSELVK